MGLLKIMPYLLVMALLVLEQAGPALGACTASQNSGCAKNCKQKFPCFEDQYVTTCCVDFNIKPTLAIQKPPKGAYCLCCREDESTEGFPVAGTVTSMSSLGKMCHCDAPDDKLNKSIASKCNRKPNSCPPTNG